MIKLFIFTKKIREFVFFNNVISVDSVLIRSEVLNTRFVCDLNKCKGACCTIYSEFGAPIVESEINEIEKCLDVILDYLNEINIEEIKRNGFFERKSGELFLKSVANRQCVFVYYENQIAKCAIEKAFIDKKINLKKPISCHLFPIRISKFGGDILRYEKFVECEPALEKGKLQDVTIAEFCKESLIRLYGEKWYLLLEEKLNR
jgi:hypothetical protein